MLLPDLVSLQLFVRAVESGSLSKAARQSHIAVAAASRRIAILEARYRVPLLHRTAHGVQPTTAGVDLARYARQLLDVAHRADVALGDYAAGAKGRIRMDANTSAITQFLPSDIAEFTARFGDVKVEIEERRSSEIVQSLREGRIDVGIVMEGVRLDGLEHFPYRSDRLVAVVPRGHPLKRRAVAFASILDFDLVGLDSTAAMMRLLRDAARAAGKPLRLRIEVRSFESVCKFVQAGMGIGILPEAAARNFAPAMGLRLVRLTDEWARRSMYVCVRDLAVASSATKRLVEQLVQGAAVRKTRTGR